MTEFIRRLMGEITIAVIIPSSILAVLFMLLAYVLMRAQRRADFDIAGFLRDESGKESALRAFAFVALGMTSWVMATLVFLNQMNETYFLYYNMTWSGALVLRELAQKWDGVVPFSIRKQQDPPPQ